MKLQDYLDLLQSAMEAPSDAILVLHLSKDGPVPLGTVGFQEGPRVQTYTRSDFPKLIKRRSLMCSFVAKGELVFLNDRS